MKSTRSLKKPRSLWAFSLFARQLRHAGSDDLQASAFKAAVDLADDIFCHGVWFDDRQGAFDCHCKNSNKKKGLNRELSNSINLGFYHTSWPQPRMPLPSPSPLSVRLFGSVVFCPKAFCAAFQLLSTGGNMIPNMQQTYDLGATTQAIRHRVLRNTYWLLALSMIPTVFGAFLGVSLQLPMLTGGMGFIVFMAIAFGFIFAIEKTKDSAVGVAVLLGFTFFMGLMLTPLLRHTLGYSNGGSLIMTAFGGTACVFAVMASIATTSKRDFSAMGSWLMAGVVVLILASVANIFLGMSALSVVISVLAIGIFSAFILFDVQRIVNGGETNYIRATLSIYLDVYNIFTSMLSLLGIGGGSRD
jgi:modulator of FtsH protease